ncbi:signal recognition particle-docking protein FtsY [Pseudomonas citronellolis]|uniref:signal recognition particle-docking protein FtsY n=1 Tax=Pseudomonas citronellolis TaxID=53408 RepID=UPI00071835E2|nr:signal recognition particle-docking protein FtsY [Pseudomonas citronellolis]KRV81353.1 signal recognition particle-docking protein FtsY [Pseudomonas citronellolis]KRW76129.1 signal recognition particle-docking protein FtsY [Pseudomonas citronellolis]
MFGSNDDKKAPQGGEKKGLFSWFRKKPQAEETVAPASEAEAAAAQPTESPAQPEQPPAAEAPRPAPVDELRTPLPVAPAEPLAPAPQAESVPAEPLEPVRPVEPQAPVEPQPPVEAAAPVAPAAPVVESVPAPAPVAEQPLVAEPAPAAIEKPAVPSEAAKLGFFARLKQGLSKTSASLGEGMASLFLGKKAIDDDLLDEIETRLLTADVGVEATTAIVQNLTRRVARKELADSEALYKALQEELAGLLRPVEQPLAIAAGKQPYVILVVGVNGVGKTTTIGKLAKKLQQDGKKVMLAAGDTFRAAAVEQLQVWGERNNIAVIAQHTGADSASVIFDAVQAAKARGVDVLIADTAGRLHTKDNLMEELKKVRRVIGKLDDTAPHEVLLVLDAGTGQNAINQAKQFNNAVELTGLALTKLDGTAKGGVIFALAKQFGLPIRYIGVGEGIDDLRTFEADAFVRALFETRETA